MGPIIRADKIIRECSQAVVYCKGYLPVHRAAGGEDRMWRQRRLFRWQTFDAAEFEDFTAGKREQLPALINDWHYGPRSPAFAAYDTFDAVSVVGTVTDSGRCYVCSGKRDVPQCSCPDYVERKKAAGSRARQAVGQRTADAAHPVTLPDLAPARVTASRG